MREEISEPQQWRTHTRRQTATTGCRGSRRQAVGQGSDLIASLPLEAVDAVFAEESVHVEPARGSRRDLVSQEQTGAAVAEQSFKAFRHSWRCSRHSRSICRIC